MKPLDLFNFLRSQAAKNKSKPRPDPCAPIPATKQDLEKVKNEILMKLSELAGALAPSVALLPQIAADIATLKSNQADPELPTEAASNITALQSGIQSIADSVKPA